MITATIYKNDSTQDICSANPDSLIEADIAKCYGSEWLYYSFDDCNDPDSSSSGTTALPAVESRRVGAIVGGILGGAIVLAVVVIGIFLYFRKKKTNALATTDSKTWELTAIHVADSNPRHEMYADDAQELPTKEVFSELPGSLPSGTGERAPGHAAEPPTEYKQLSAELEAPVWI
jgi:hypothetical protein